MLFFNAPGRRSSGPGVLMPNTMFGTDLLELDVVAPRTSSSNNPCSRNLSAIGCTGFFILSTAMFLSRVLAALFISPTGSGCFVSNLVLSLSDSSTSVDAAIAGIMLLVNLPGMQAIKYPCEGSPSTNATRTVTPTSGGTNHIP